MVISNWENPLFSMVYTEHISALLELHNASWSLEVKRVSNEGYIGKKLNNLTNLKLRVASVKISIQ